VVCTIVAQPIIIVSTSGRLIDPPRQFDAVRSGMCNTEANTDALNRAADAQINLQGKAADAQMSLRVAPQMRR
jgi:hypothetical protein